MIALLLSTSCGYFLIRWVVVVIFITIAIVGMDGCYSATQWWWCLNLNNIVVVAVVRVSTQDYNNCMCVCVCKKKTFFCFHFDCYICFWHIHFSDCAKLCACVWKQISAATDAAAAALSLSIIKEGSLTFLRLLFVSIVFCDSNSYLLSIWNCCCRCCCSQWHIWMNPHTHIQKRGWFSWVFWNFVVGVAAVAIAIWTNTNTLLLLLSMLL